MNIPIGFTLNGKTKIFANQYLVTEFFSFGVPIFPVNSYFVNDENGLRIKIPISKNSLSTFYLGGTLTWLGCILFGCSWMLATELKDRFVVSYIEFLPFISSFSILTFGLYNYFIKAKPTRREIKKRTVLQMATGINALPSWLGTSEAIKMYDSLKVHYPIDWKSLIKNQNYENTDFYRLFSLISYESCLNPSVENIELMKKMEVVFYR